jgi:hypothetical protein
VKCLIRQSIIQNIIVFSQGQTSEPAKDVRLAQHQIHVLYKDVDRVDVVAEHTAHHSALVVAHPKNARVGIVALHHCRVPSARAASWKVYIPKHINPSAYDVARHSPREEPMVAGWVPPSKVGLHGHIDQHAGRHLTASDVSISS